MFGDVNKQINRLVKISEIKAPKNTSKHEEGKSIRESFYERNGKMPTSHELAKETRIIAQEYLVKNTTVWRELAKTTGIKDIESISNRKVEAFLRDKIERDISYKNFENHCSYMTKLEKALNDYAASENTGKTYSFDKAINYTKSIASERLEKNIDARVYDRPADIVNNIKDEKFNLSASLMYEGGARINEASLIDSSRLGGYKEDELRGRVGVITLHGADTKGGKQRDLIVSEKTYQRLSDYVNRNGELRIDRNNGERQELREAIRDASIRSDQSYTGAHGLRHNFAVDRVTQLQSEGLRSYQEAIAIVSREMGHERPSITEHYLRG